VRTFPQLLAVIFINEVIPRCKKHNVSIKDVSIKLIAAICRWELDGKISRKETREMLDVYFQIFDIERENVTSKKETTEII
jgi:Glu-tRNA(Gln) amidotransferase subunit E-like FAD-binding protein